MDHRILYLLLIAASVIVSCKNTNEKPADTSTPKSYSQIKNADWFIGVWDNTSAEGELTERWKKVNDSVYHGESYYVIAGKDTVFSETVELEETKGKLTYTVTVPNQNDEQPVSFEATSITGNQIIFKNPEHDFPNKIVYNKIGNDSLVAEIFGHKNGKPATEKFAMKKLE